MKKTMVFVMTLMLVLSLGATGVFAAGGFVKSPSLNPAPELIHGISKDGQCDGTFVITPYDERDTLSDDELKEFEESYDDVKENEDLSKLVSELNDVAKDKNLDVTEFAVSDLFHTHVENCSHEEGKEHGTFDVTLKADTLNKYVGLLRYSDGEWSLVKEAIINKDGHLVFEAAKLGSYAIVVNTDASLITPPVTGDAFPWIALALVAMIAVTAVVVFSFKEKEKA
ncbi:MAG: hypothetical protein E7388_02135 [Ruminococcaceae bacterium]|nr:hypothetical protein [Oscillospiraceae bacterium]